MFFDIVLIYLSSRNYYRAKRKGANGWIWAVITAVLSLVAMSMGMLVVARMNSDKVNLSLIAAKDKKVAQAAMQALEAVVQGSVLNFVTIAFFGVGGYLLIRFILDRKPDLKEPEAEPEAM